jgi:hypothetical protein
MKGWAMSERQNPEQSIREWFHIMERCFQNLDYATARKLIADDVIAFKRHVRRRRARDPAMGGQLAGSPRLYLQLRSTPLGYFR